MSENKEEILANFQVIFDFAFVPIFHAQKPKHIFPNCERKKNFPAAAAAVSSVCAVCVEIFLTKGYVVYV